MISLIIQRPISEGEVSGEYRATEAKAVSDHEFNHRGTSPKPHLAAKRGVSFPRTPRTSYDASSRRNFESANALAFILRAFPLRIDFFENNPTDRAKTLGGFRGASVLTSSHVEQSNMERFANVQKVFDGECCE